MKFLFAIFFIFLVFIESSFSTDYIAKDCTDIWKTFLFKSSIKKKKESFLKQYSSSILIYKELSTPFDKIKNYKYKIRNSKNSLQQFSELIALLDSLHNENKISTRTFKEQVLTIGIHNIKNHKAGVNKVFFKAAPPFLTLNSPITRRGKKMHITSLDNFIGDDKLYELIESLANSLAYIQTHYTPLPWEEGPSTYSHSIHKLIHDFNNTEIPFQTTTVSTNIFLDPLGLPFMYKKWQWWSINFLRSAIVLFTAFIVIENIEIIQLLPEKLRAFRSIGKGLKQSQEQYPDGKMKFANDLKTLCASTKKWMIFYKKRVSDKLKKNEIRSSDFSQKRHIHFKEKFNNMNCPNS